MMREPPFHLDQQRRAIVLDSILQTVKHRGWLLLAAHIRTEHVHVLLETNCEPRRAMGDLKALCSVRLSEEGFDVDRRKRWARFGSVQLLTDDSAVRRAVRYVAEEQGEPMAVYIHPEFRDLLSRLQTD
jgi:hypothetical protein